MKEGLDSRASWMILICSELFMSVIQRVKCGISEPESFTIGKMKKKNTSSERFDISNEFGNNTVTSIYI